MMGFYLEVTNIEYPSAATPGQVVNVNVTVKNKSTSLSQIILIECGYDSLYIYSSPEYQEVAPQASAVFNFNFGMPDHSIVYNIWSYIWVEYPDQAGYWYNDDTQAVNINLEQALSGAITSAVLEYSGNYANLPVTNIPANIKGKIHIHAQNTSGATKEARVTYDVFTPSGSIIYHFDGTDHYADPYEDCDFYPVIDTFDINSVGWYVVEAALYIDGTPVDVAAYDFQTIPSVGIASFDYLTPTQIPSAVLGSTVSISLPIKNTSGRTVIVTPKVTMYEGSVLGSPGSQIGSIKTLSSISFASGATKPVTFSWIVAGALDRKDVILELYEGSTFISSNHYDDVIGTVTSGGVPPPGGECSIDADCPEGYICKDGVCVPVGKVTNWTPILIGGGVLLAAVALASQKKPSEKKVKKK